MRSIPPIPGQTHLGIYSHRIRPCGCESRHLYRGRHGCLQWMHGISFSDRDTGRSGANHLLSRQRGYHHL